MQHEVLERELSALTGSDPAAARAAWANLVARGEVAAQACLEAWPNAKARERVLLAQLLRSTANAAQIGPIQGSLAADPQASVRRLAAEFLGSPALGQSELEPRRQSLEVLCHDRDTAVRAAAIRGLANFGDEAAFAFLAELLHKATPEDRRAVVAALPESLQSWPLVYAQVERAFSSDSAERLDDASLAGLLPLYGRLLADRPDGGESARESAALVLALRHPAEEVQSAARLAFERFLARLRELNEGERALRLLVALEARGLDSRLIQFQRARFAFYPLGDLASARSAAQAMRGPQSSGEEPVDRLWLLRSHYMEGLSWLGEGDAQAAALALGRARALLDGLLSMRRDQFEEQGRLEHGETLLLCCLLEVATLLTDFSLAPEDEARHLESARRAHTAMLEAQLVYAHSGLDTVASWDAVLDAELSPLRLLCAGIDLPGFSVTQALQAVARLGDCLASVAPAEFPGFTARGITQDVLQDPRRRELLIEVLFARLENLGRELQQARERIIQCQEALPGVLPDPDLLYEVQVLRYRRDEVRQALDALDGEGQRALRELRIPSSLALWLARDLRNDGRTVEARRLATQMREDLEREGLHHSFFWGLELLAEIEMAIGSSWTDEGEPERAASELLAAVERLQDIERRLAENGALPRQLEHVRSLRASALVSLAVNANVKLGQPERALHYYEQAYALRQDEFMRVLLACYRARSGRFDEARALLREVRPGPQTYYNLACTHALMGETERALHYLRLELEENHFSPGSRQRQQAWAQSDPDLGSLRQDPTFQRLLAEK